MAVKVQQVLEILEQIAPPELACSWDNVGLLVDAGRPVTSIMTALDITADVVRDAAESGCELIVSHHPVIFDPLRRVTAEDVPAMLLQNGISAICMHTNLDAAPGGVNDVLADLLRIENRRDFADNCGRIGTLNVPTTAQQLAETCSRMLHTHCKFVEADHPVEKLAEVSGAGGSYLQQAIDEGADCLVTGEAAHHIAILAKQKGVTIQMDAARDPDRDQAKARRAHHGGQRQAGAHAPQHAAQHPHQREGTERIPHVFLVPVKLRHRHSREHGQCHGDRLQNCHGRSPPL